MGSKTYSTFHGRTDFACMQRQAKIVDFSFDNEKLLNWIEMVSHDENFHKFM